MGSRRRSFLHELRRSSLPSKVITLLLLIFVPSSRCYSDSWYGMRLISSERRAQKLCNTLEEFERRQHHRHKRKLVLTSASIIPTTTSSSLLKFSCKDDDPVGSSLAENRDTKTTSTPSSIGQAFKETDETSYRRELEKMKIGVQNCLAEEEYGKGFTIIEDMLRYIGKIQKKENHDMKGIRFRLSAFVDEIIQAYTQRAFLTTHRGVGGSSSSSKKKKNIRFGMKVLQLQISSSSILASPYDTIPRHTYILALKALTGIITNEKRAKNNYIEQERYDFPSKGCTSADAAFRILQRLVTGISVRHLPTDDEGKGAGRKGSDYQYNNNNIIINNNIHERDFNMVLNAFCNIGHMDMAHKVVALQERTANAPPLSPVTYSILLKGYGRQGDIDNVKMTLSHFAQQRNSHSTDKNSILDVDTIMLNSLIDAYVNCNELQSAKDVFNLMRSNSPKIDVSTSNFQQDLLPLLATNENIDTVPNSLPCPDARTYNTILKGLAKEGSFEEAIVLSNEMKDLKLWDDITTNTLVNVAVTTQNFDFAEVVLSAHTSTAHFDDNKSNNLKRNSKKKRRINKHPNVEAYTELLDGYGKAGMLDRSLHTLQQMRQRGVMPNVVTYTCIINALAKSKKVDEAKKIMEFMESTEGIRPNRITYNSFISGLLAADRLSQEKDNTDDINSNNKNDTENHKLFDNYVEESLKLFGKMRESGIRPDDVTISVLIEAMGKCKIPRTENATQLISSLEKDGIRTVEDNLVGTAMIRMYAASNNLRGVIETFRKINNPDIIAINAFLGACCRCGKLKRAMEFFEFYFGDGTTTGINSSNSVIRRGRQPRRHQLQPDVITYTILISELLNRNTVAAAERARILYRDMRQNRDILPDVTLVDLILTAMVKGGRLGLQKQDMRFIISVLKDAEKLEWGPGRLEMRKRGVRAVMVGRMSEVWKVDEDEYGMASNNDDVGANQEENQEDELFKRKGWNKVDSGFRLWGSSTDDAKAATMTSIRENNSKKNDMDDFFASVEGALNDENDGVDDFLAKNGWNDVDSGFRIL